MLSQDGARAIAWHAASVDWAAAEQTAPVSQAGNSQSSRPAAVPIDMATVSNHARTS